MFKFGFIIRYKSIDINFKSISKFKNILKLLKKLQSAESTIESLNAQLVDYESSDALQRARDQHETIVAGLQRKHQDELLNVKQQLDKANHEKHNMVTTQM